MGRWLCACLLLCSLSARPAWAAGAAWERFATNAESSTIYLDHGTRRTGALPRVWMLVDYAEPDRFGHLSAKVLWQAECREGRAKALTYLHFDGPMGEGRAETNNEPGDWIYPAPESIIGDVFAYLCNARP